MVSGGKKSRFFFDFELEKPVCSCNVFMQCTCRLSRSTLFVQKLYTSFTVTTVIIHCPFHMRSFDRFNWVGFISLSNILPVPSLGMASPLKIGILFYQADHKKILFAVTWPTQGICPYSKFSIGLPDKDVVFFFILSSYIQFFQFLLYFPSKMLRMCSSK